MVGLVTPVIRRVGSVTSTCLRSSWGDIRSRSGPISPVSSGTFFGQSWTPNGSAAGANQLNAIIIPTTKAGGFITLFLDWSDIPARHNDVIKPNGLAFFPILLR